MSLPITSSVVHGISTALAHLDTSGATVTPGVSSLGSRRTGAGDGRAATVPRVARSRRRADALCPDRESAGPSGLAGRAVDHLCAAVRMP